MITRIVVVLNILDIFETSRQHCTRLQKLLPTKTSHKEWPHDHTECGRPGHKTLLHTWLHECNLFRNIRTATYLGHARVSFMALLHHHASSTDKCSTITRIVVVLNILVFFSQTT